MSFIFDPMLYWQFPSDLGWTDPVNLNHVADMLHKQRSASINEFEIFHEKGSNTWHVVGSGLQRFVQMTNWRLVDFLFCISFPVFVIPWVYINVTARSIISNLNWRSHDIEDAFIIFLSSFTVFVFLWP